MIFKGTYEATLDYKGRITIPRDLIFPNNNETYFVVTANYATCCLHLYTSSEWIIVESRLRELPTLDSHVRRLQRHMIGYATKIIINHNRLVLPQKLICYARLDKKTLLIDSQNKIEIWNPNEWQDSRITSKYN